MKSSFHTIQLKTNASVCTYHAMHAITSTYMILNCINIIYDNSIKKKTKKNGVVAMKKLAHFTVYFMRRAIAAILQCI